MGLGIYIKGEISKPPLSFKKKSFELSSVQEYLTKHSSGLFRDFLSFTQNETNLYATIHPCEETVDFELAGETLICSAKTNSVGPGYHAYLIELIEKLGSGLGIKWNWNLEEGEEYYQDETGYHEHRNYDQLQFEMLKWLNALCRNFDEEGGKQLMISLPMGSPRMKLDYFAVSPIQIWEREWFNKVANLVPEDLHWAGKEFFVWWNKQPDALFYKHTGIALLNVECPWHFPADDKEKKILSTIDQCFEQARKIDPFIELPDEDWNTVKNFLSESETDIPQTEYGYRKHLMTFDLTDNWLIDLPGTMYRGEDGNTIIFYDHIFTVRSIAYGITKKNSDADYAEHFFDNNENAGAEVLYSETELAGKAIVYYALDKEANSEYWILQGVRVKNDKFMLSTICFPTDEYKEWAAQTWNSLRNPD
jgi:hypothetical protein